MPQFPPDRLVLHDRKSQEMLFDLIAAGKKFEFDEMLRLWFDNQEPCLVKFLEWLDYHGLEIRKKA